MRSPTAALLWEIWQRQRSNVAAIVVLTVIARLIDIADTPEAAANPSPLITMLAMAAFGLLFAVFNCAEFPRRLFTLPVTSLRLVAVPAIAAGLSIQILYLAWMAPLSRGGSAGPAFAAVLLGSCAVLYLSVLWTLERAGPMRLVVIGALFIALFAIGLLPSFPPSPPPWWRSEPVLAGLVALVAAASFVLAWRHVSRVRAGAGRSSAASAIAGWMAAASPARRRAFTSAAGAHFWFEWRLSGVILPALVAFVMLAGVVPLSWMARDSAGDTFRLLVAALAAPIVFAVPIGMAFSRPAFWSEDLHVPAFVAVRPLSSEDLVAIRVRVATASVGLAWLIVLVTMGVWLSMWGDAGAILPRLEVPWWKLALVPIVAMFLTWRFMVSRLWSGLSGISRLFSASIISTVFIIVSAIGFDASLLPGWMLEDPDRTAPLVWGVALVVVAKFAIAIFAWRRAPPRYLGAYLAMWVVGTAACLAFTLSVAPRVRLGILIALLAMPLARVGLAPLLLARNRHR